VAQLRTGQHRDDKRAALLRRFMRKEPKAKRADPSARGPAVPPPRAQP
jgi:hypothetical protein